MRYASRRDRNHTEVLEFAQAYGAIVLDMAPFCCGFDALVWFRGTLFIIEIKDGDKVPSARKLTTAEAKVREMFPHCYKVVNGTADMYHVLFGTVQP